MWANFTPPAGGFTSSFNPDTFNPGTQLILATGCLTFQLFRKLPRSNSGTGETVSPSERHGI